MISFMHKLAEGLRSREQYLEDHSVHPIFDGEDGDSIKEEYLNLLSDLKEFSERVDQLTAVGKEYDEHFIRNIKNEHEKLSVRIDAWAKKIK